MSLKAKLEAIIYATEEPVTLGDLAVLLKDATLAELRAEEEARLALNETVYDPSADRDTEDENDSYTEAEEAPDAAIQGNASAEAIALSVGQSSSDPNQMLQPQSAAGKTPSNAEGAAEEKEQLKAVKARLNEVIEQLIAEYASADRGMEIRHIAGGYRMATKPEHHDVVVSFAKSLKPPVRLSLQALETLSVIAYKQPITVPEISEIRGVDSAGVIATLLDRKLITTAGRKQVIGRPILYKTTKEFLLRFGLNDVSELPTTEEFEKLGDPQAELFGAAAPDAAGSAPSSEEEPVTEAVPEHEAQNSLMGETSMPADGTRATEAEPVMQVAPQPPKSAETGEATISSEPVTEAVPDATSQPNLTGDSNVPSDGVYATEAQGKGNA